MAATRWCRRIAQESVGQQRIDGMIEDLGRHASQQVLVSILGQADNEGNAPITGWPAPHAASSRSKQVRHRRHVPLTAPGAYGRAR